MTVTRAPVRQQSYLTEWDRQMAEYLRQMSGSIGPQDIASEAYGGKFPVGTMTAKILSGVLAGTSDRRAMNRQEQAKKAQVALLTQAQEYSDPLPLEFEGAGKFTDRQGNFTQELAPVYKGVAEDANIEAYNARMLREQFPEGVLAGGPTPPGKVAVAMAHGPRSEFETYGTPYLKPEPEITQNYVEPERELLLPQKTVQGITIEGSKEDPDWWDRNVSGDIRKVTVKNEIELAQLAGYDPLEYLTFKQQKQTVGHEILTVDQAEALGIKNASSMIGENSFLQQDLKTGKISLVNAGGNKTEVKVDVNTGESIIGYDELGLGFGELGKALYKGLEERSNSLTKLRNTDRNSDMLIDMMNNSEFQTGKFAETKGLIIGYAESLGLLPDNAIGDKLRQDLIDMQSIGAGYNKIVLSVIKTLGRNPTDLDLKYMIKTMPSLDKLPEANMMILQQAQAINRANIEIIEWEEKFQVSYYEETGLTLAQTPKTIRDFKEAKRAKAKEITEKLQKTLEVTQARYREITGDISTTKTGKNKDRRTKYIMVNGKRTIVWDDD